MDEFRKQIHSHDPKIVFIAASAIALIGFIFFLALPAVSVFGFGATGVKVFDGAPFPLFLMLLYLLLGPLGYIAFAFLKKELSTTIAGLLFLFTLFVSTYSGSTIHMGIGSILNLILYFILTVYSFLRKGASVGF